MTVEKNFTEKKLHTKKSILVSTFIGGPIATGILLRENFINIGNEKFGRNALIISIVFTILIFVGLFSIPDNIMDKIPNMIIPIIYTLITSLVIGKYQEDSIKKHLENGNLFYSIWRAIGIGVIGMIIIMSGIFVFVFTSPDNFDTEKYDNGLSQIYENDDKALNVYTYLDANDGKKAIAHIENVSIPAWKDNLLIISRLDTIKGLDKVLIEQNEVLRQYTNLRIQSVELIKKAIAEETNIYDKQIEEVLKKIEDL